MSPANFSPEILTITIHSQNELNALTCLFNCPLVLDSIMQTFGVSFVPISDSLIDAGGSTGNYNDLLVKLKNHFDKL